MRPNMKSLPSRALPRQCRVPYLHDVPREPKDFTIDQVLVQRHERSGLIRTGPETAVPTRFSASVVLTQPELTVWMDVRVDQAGTRPRLIDLRLTTDIRAAITTSTLRRVLVDQLLQAALDRATVAVEGHPEIHPDAFRAEGEPTDHAWVSPPPRPSSRGRATPDDRAREAARIYSEAVIGGSRAPGVAVANAMGYSRAQVARYIRRARDLRMLPPLEQSSPQTDSTGHAPEGAGDE